MRRSALRQAAVVAAVALLAGCSGRPATGTVAGTVTLDGQPLKAGTIKFVPEDPKIDPVLVDVVDGNYTAEVPVGTVKIEVSSPKVLSKRKMYNTPDSPVIEEKGEPCPTATTPGRS
jgi:hypothetical protein